MPFFSEYTTVSDILPSPDCDPTLEHGHTWLSSCLDCNSISKLTVIYNSKEQFQLKSLIELQSCIALLTIY